MKDWQRKLLEEGPNGSFPEDEWEHIVLNELFENPGGWDDSVHDREAQSRIMKENNPMFNSETVRKMQETRKRDGTTWAGNRNPMKKEANKKLWSERMKRDNPVFKLDKNPRSRHITVLWQNGEKTEYEYIKKLTEEKEIPYPTVKYLLYNGCASKKHKIKKVYYTA